MPEWIRGRDCDVIGLENGNSEVETGENDSVGVLQMLRQKSESEEEDGNRTAALDLA